MDIRDWSIPGSDGQTIWGNTHLPPNGVSPLGTLILCHGFKGYKDYGFLPPLADAAAAKGFITHRFNFSHSGMTNNVDTFERPDLFERDTWSRQIQDLRAVIEADHSGVLPLPETTDNREPTSNQNDRDHRTMQGGLPLFLFGHSRGGLTVLLTGATLYDPSNDHNGNPRPPKGIIAAASPDNACRLGEDDIRRLRQRGYVETHSSRTGQVLRIGKSWLEDYEYNRMQFDPCDAVMRIGCPILLVHGENDETIDIDCSRNLAAAAGERAYLELISKATHTFNCPNPFNSDEDAPPQTQRLIEAVVDFVLETATTKTTVNDGSFQGQ